MVRFRPRMAALAAVTLLFGLTAGPLLHVGGARAQDEPVELLVWDQFTESSVSPVTEEIYADFMAQNPNITITREAFSSDQMRQTVNTAIASGTGPDVILYDTGASYAGILAEAGLLLPLEEYAAQYGWTEQVAPWAVEATTLNGAFYGMPLTTDLIGMYSNQTLLEQEGMAVPETVDDLLTFCGEAAERGYIPIAFGNNPGWEAFHQFDMTSNQMLGPEAMEALLFENEGSWDTPEIVTAIETFFVTMRDAGCLPEDANAITYEDGNSLFFNGEALLHTTGSWMVGDIVEAMPDVEIGFVPFPEIAGGQGRYWISGIGSSWFISASSANPDAAAAFIDYLYSPEALAKWVGGNRFFVPVEVDTSSMELDALTTAVIEARQTAIDEGIPFGYSISLVAPPEFNDMMQNGFQAVLAGDKTPAEQAADLQAAWEEGAPEVEATPAA